MAKKSARQAAEALTDLNIMHAIIGVLENGTVYTRTGQRAADKIIRICKEQSDVQLRAYDRAMARVPPHD